MGFARGLRQKARANRWRRRARARKAGYGALPRRRNACEIHKYPAATGDVFLWLYLSGVIILFGLMFYANALGVRLLGLCGCVAFSAALGKQNSLHPSERRGLIFSCLHQRFQRCVFV